MKRPILFSRYFPRSLHGGPVKMVTGGNDAKLDYQVQNPLFRAQTTL